MSEADPQIRRPPPAATLPPRRSLPAECASLLEGRGPLRVLDIGCGRASPREFLARRGHRYVGVDIRSPQADIRGDAHALPFGDSQFDAALLFSVLQYSLYPRRVLKEARRVIRPAGTLTGCVAFLEPAVWGGLMHLSARGLATLLEQVGFELEYIWPSWSVFEAISSALPLSDPQPLTGPAATKEVERALKSYPDAFKTTLDFSGSIYFHAVRGRVTNVE